MSGSAAVTLSRAEYERLLAAVEEAEDSAAIARAMAREAEVGKAAARRDYLPVEMFERLLAGESPVRVWREHRRVPAATLASAVNVTRDELAAIEDGVIPLSPEMAAALAAALEVAPEEIAPEQGPGPALAEIPESDSAPALVLTDADAQYRYRILRTRSGYRLGFRHQSVVGLTLTPDSVFPDEASARAGLDALKAFHAWWYAILEGGGTHKLEQDAIAMQKRLEAVMSGAVLAQGGTAEGSSQEDDGANDS